MKTQAYNLFFQTSQKAIRELYEKMLLNEKNESFFVDDEGKTNEINWFDVYLNGTRTNYNYFDVHAD